MTNPNIPNLSNEKLDPKKEIIVSYLKEHGDMLSRVGMDEDMQEHILKLIEKSDQDTEKQSQLAKQQELISQLKSQNEEYRKQLSEKGKNELGGDVNLSSEVEQLSNMVQHLTTTMQEFSRNNITSWQDQQEKNESMQKNLKHFNEIAYQLNLNIRSIEELSDQLQSIRNNMRSIEEISNNINYIKELANSMNYIKDLSYKMR